MYGQSKAEKLHGTAFTVKVTEIAKRLKVNPSWLMRVMDMESSFQTTAKNPKATATGLIQFLEGTAKALGTSTAALAKMDGLQQLEYVYKYYKPYTGKMNSFAELYMVAFYPFAMKMSSAFVLGSEHSAAYAKKIALANKAVDKNGNGTITKGEFVTHVNSTAPATVQATVNPFAGMAGVASAGALLGVIIAGAFYYIRFKGLA